MIDVNALLQPFTEMANAIVQTQLFQQFGLLMLFLWPIFTVSIFPIPIEVPITTLIYGHFNVGIILLVTWAAMLSGSLFLYGLVMTGKFGIKRTTLFDEIEESHLLHRHRWVMFSTLPIIFPLGDSLMIWAAAEHMKPQSFVLPLTIGTFLRSVIAILISLGLLSLPHVTF